MRRFLLGLVGVLAVAGGLAVVSITGAAPQAMASTGGRNVPAHTSGPVCNINACEEVFNSAQGSDFIDDVIVYDPNDQSFSGTYRLLFNGTVVGTATGTGPVQFNVGGSVGSGTCIQGGIIGLTDARSPCWNAP